MASLTTEEAKSDVVCSHTPGADVESSAAAMRSSAAAEGAQVDTVQLIQQVMADAVVVEGRSPLESGQPGVGQDCVVRARIAG